MALIQVGDQWQFGNEFELEDVLWQNLPTLLNLTPFKRQYAVRGQFCDILATDDRQGLVVLELKNTEDRYVVQQLTRYYDALKAENPFGPEVDLGQPIRLVAIAPSFHQDTLIDCKYSRLEIELVSFHLQEQADGLYLELTGDGSGKTAPLLLSQEPSTPPPAHPVPEPPRKLLNWLSYVSEGKFNAIMAARHQILSFDQRMKEMNEPQSLRYGKGKSKPCAEILKAKTYSGKPTATLALWLPAPAGKAQVLRMLITTDQTGTLVNRLDYSPHKVTCRDWWFLPEFSRFGTAYGEVPPTYQPRMNAAGEFTLASLVDLALETWRERL